MALKQKLKILTMNYGEMMISLKDKTVPASNLSNTFGEEWVMTQSLEDLTGIRLLS